MFCGCRSVVTGCSGISVVDNCGRFLANRNGNYEAMLVTEKTITVRACTACQVGTTDVEARMSIGVKTEATVMVFVNSSDGGDIEVNISV